MATQRRGNRRKEDILSQEFEDVKSSIEVKFIVWATIFSFAAVLFLLIVASPQYPEYQFSWILIALLSLSVLVLIPYDFRNIAGFDIPFKPIYTIPGLNTDEKFRVFMWFFIFIVFLILPSTITGSSIVQSAVGYGYMSIDTMINTLSVAATTNEEIYSLSLVTLQIVGETLWFNMIPTFLAFTTVKYIRRFNFMNYKVLAVILTFILFPFLAIFNSAVIAPAFHWNAHDISFDNLDNAAPSAFLFALWTAIGQIFGVPAIIMAHLGWNLGVGGWLLSATAVPVVYKGIPFMLKFIK